MKTTSLELSKQLQKLGVKQESYFYWDMDKEQQALVTAKEMNISYTDTLIKNEIFSAYTLDEILNMLPDKIKDNYVYYFLKSDKTEEVRYGIYYARAAIEDGVMVEFLHENPAEAAGQLLVWCIENGYVKPEELNAAL